MTNQQVTSGLLVALILLIGAFFAWNVMHQPDRRTVGEKIGDAVDELKDRTPAEKLHDDIKDIAK
jgi:hypothetical protein